MKVLCYGDSNTYGYDPRDLLGGRYDEKGRWPEVLAGLTGIQVVNAGENGRTIPKHKAAADWFDKQVEVEKPNLVIIMLGGNDMLRGASSSECGERMYGFVRHIRETFPRLDIFLVAPVAFHGAAEYRALAEKWSVRFVDASLWDIPMAADGIHFTEEGHRFFADKMSFCL